MIQETNGKIALYQRLSSEMKAKLNQLTYRQYLALTYIISSISKNKIPLKNELKKVIGFKTDRMLNITLKALEKKGFIKFNGLGHNPIAEPTNIALSLKDLFIDNLLICDDIENYETVREMITNIKQKNNPRAPKLFTISAHLPLDTSLKYLNNDKKIFHRWYEYLEDFPPSLVWKKIEQYAPPKDGLILDPFVGSGTTLIVAKLMGYDAVGIDINPVATFVTNVKASWENIDYMEFKKIGEDILNELYIGKTILSEIRLTTESLSSMPLMERNQWLKPITQNYVSYVKERIMEIDDKHLRNAFLLALIEAAKQSSNVSFCPGTSFYPFKNRPTFPEAFKHQIQKMYEDLVIINNLRNENLKYGNITIYTDDCKEMSRYLKKDSIDFIFTSPPYPNDLEYTRQTKLELYLLDIVKNEKDIRAIKRKMVKGSTKLIYEDSNSSKYVEDIASLQDIIIRLEDAFKDKNWGWNYPKMVKEYFGDMYIVFKETEKVLSNKGYALFVVGEQTYKNILIPVGSILCDIAKELGLNATKEVFRIRRSTLHTIPLKEEIVIIYK